MSVDAKNKKRFLRIGSSLFFILLFAYGSMVPSTIGVTDSGELATVAYSLSIAHPTGYPLFTLLGRCVSMFPLERPIVLLNFFSTLLVTFGMIFFFVSLTALVKHVYREWKAPAYFYEVASFAATLIFAFSATVWMQALTTEVYALHVLFLAALFFCVIHGFLSTEGKEALRWYFLAAYVLGLSFGNHMTTVLFVPGLFFVLWQEGKRWQWQRALYIVLFLLFGIGVSVYLFLPIRASQQPPLLWGNPTTLEQFLWHISGKQYRVWMFEGFATAQKQLTAYISNFNNEFLFPLLVFALVGCVQLWKSFRTLCVVLLLFYVVTIFYAINYDIFDIEPYFLLSHFVVAIFCGVGVVAVTYVAFVRWRIERPLIIVFLLLLPLAQWFFHVSNVKEQTTDISETFAREVLLSLPPKTVVFSGLWDYFVSPALYLQNVERVREDVVVIDFHLLKNRLWYYTQVERQAPWLVTRCRNEIDLFLVELSKFERGEPFNSAMIQKRWEELLKSLIEASLHDYAVVVDVRIEREFSPAFYRIPWGKMIRLVHSSDSVKEYKFSSFIPSLRQKKNKVEQDAELYQRTVAFWAVQWRNRFLEGKGEKPLPKR